jgi:hypothetical protein
VGDGGESEASTDIGGRRSEGASCDRLRDDECDGGGIGGRKRTWSCGGLEEGGT